MPTVFGCGINSYRFCLLYMPVTKRRQVLCYCALLFVFIGFFHEPPSILQDLCDLGSYAFQSKSARQGERIFNACCSNFTQPRGSVYGLGQRDTTVYNSPLRNPVRFACTVAFHAPVTLLLLLGRGCCVKYPTSFVGISAFKQPLGSMLGHVATFDESEKGPRVRKITVAVLVKRILLCLP